MIAWRHLAILGFEPGLPHHSDDRGEGRGLLTLSRPPRAPPSSVSFAASDLSLQRQKVTYFLAERGLSGVRLWRLAQKPTKAADGLSSLGLPELAHHSRQACSS